MSIIAMSSPRASDTVPEASKKRERNTSSEEIVGPPKKKSRRKTLAQKNRQNSFPFGNIGNCKNIVVNYYNR